MKFCEKCGSLFRRKAEKDVEDSKFECGCGQITDNPDLNSKEKSVAGTSEKRSIEVVKENEEINAVTPATCTKCSNDRAYTWSKQMRGSDEPETIFFKCTKCGHSWRQSR